MKIAALQMRSGTSLEANLAQAHALLCQAAQAGVELAVLPEYFCQLGVHDTDKLHIQEPMGNGPIQTFLSSTARELGMWIVGGTLPLTDAASSVGQPGHHVFNSTLVFNDGGYMAIRYDKIHLFRFDNGREKYDESAVLSPGEQPASFELPSKDGHVWRVGLSICYDLRFPELYRRYSRSGVDLILVPAAFTYTTGKDHWEILLRARAIENLAYVVAAAQGGVHENQRRTWGHSMVVDPWGQLMQQLGEEPGLMCAELNYARVQAVRAQLPALTDRVL